MLIKDSNNNLFPQIHLHNTNAFFEDLTGKHNLAYKLQFLHTNLPTLHKQAYFSATVPPLSIHLECSPTQCIIKINATVKFVAFCQQPSSQDLCVTAAHIRSKAFRYVGKYIRFVKVPFQVLIK